MAKLVTTKYLNTKCSLEIQLQQKAGHLLSEQKTNLNNKKLALLQELERRNLEKTVQNEFASNDILKSLSLTF